MPEFCKKHNTTKLRSDTEMNDYCVNCGRTLESFEIQFEPKNKPMNNVMPDTIKCTSDGCTEDAVVSFNHLGYNKKLKCEMHWTQYKAVFCGALGVPEPITEMVNGAIKLSPEDAAIYNKAIGNSN